MKREITYVLSPDGEVSWCGPYLKRAEALNSLPVDIQNRTIFRAALGCPDSGPKISAGAVSAEMKRLAFLDNTGNAAGFVTVLPSALHVERCLERFHAPIIQALNPAEIDLPVVFDSSRADVRELISHYEAQKAMFEVFDGTPRQLKLSYAADPGLFSWMRGRKLRAESLPFTVFTATKYIRNLLSGATNGLNRVRQFSFPETHSFISSENMLDRYSWHTGLLASGMNFWFPSDWIHAIEITDEHLKRYPDFLQNMAKSSGQYTIGHICTEVKLYYSVKTMMLVDGGFDMVMLYNMQWDDTNGSLFRISTDRDGPVSILHGTLIGGAARLLPSIVGRALAAGAPVFLPPELTDPPLTLVILDGADSNAITSIQRTLLDWGVEPEILKAERIGDAIREIRRRGQAYFSVIGPREKDFNLLTIQQTSDMQREAAQTWVERLGARISRCRPDSYYKRRTSLPWRS
jgi:threonyl-tRNA synthetase